MPILDVRSPAEYAQAHIPGAVSLPLFTDDERAVVGTAYKQQSREEAIKFGLDFFGPKMRTMVGQAEKICRSNGDPTSDEKLRVAIHCWRGGMRSSAVAWLLDLYGFEVYLLEGGYKAYRQWVLGHFTKSYNFRVIGGYTGSGKTEVLERLKSLRQPAIDLEGLARHKGSAFGGLDKHPQPRPEQFENLIAAGLHQLTIEDPGRPFWIEDESQRIGDVNMPIAFWKNFQDAPLYFLDIPFDSRLDYITTHYGRYSLDQLLPAIVRIKKRLGPLETKTAVNHLLEGDLRSGFAILLKYYDKLYHKALAHKPAEKIITIPCPTVDAAANAAALLHALQHATA